MKTRREFPIAASNFYRDVTRAIVKRHDVMLPKSGLKTDI